MNRKESREIPETRAIRSDVATSGNKLTGYAIVFNSPSLPIQEKGKEFVEYILPDAFDTSLKTGRSQIENRPITFVYRHEDMAEYGDTSTNLKLVKDDKGVRFELDIPEYALHLKEAVASGRIRDMSFEFYTIKDRWEDNKRYIELGDLVHISAVPKGAYPEASVQLRQKSETWKLKNIMLRKKIGMKSK